jgi:putative PIN family toxin of toxin-antitoxin system
MIVVLDTNVIISAVLSPAGTVAEIINQWEQEAFAVATSAALIEELRRALTYERVRKFIKLTAEELERLLRFYARTAVVVESEITLAVVQEDPDDNRVLECALASQASYIVTGDGHLLELEEFDGITILSPAGFLTLLQL